MPKFDYRGRSADTTPTSGTIEAVDSFAARRQLEVSGLQVLRLTPEMAAQAADARAESLPALGSADALELAFQISELARSGLPLAAGLRAIEAELPMGRFSRATGKLAERLEAGAPADSVLAAAASCLPAHVRGMLACGIGSGRLPEVLGECLELEQLQSDVRRRVLTAIAYPVALLCLTIVWLALVLGLSLPELAHIWADFEVELPRSTETLLWLARPGVAIALLACAALLPGLVILGMSWHNRAVSGLMAEVPLIGPLWRSGNLAACCRLLAAMLDQAVPLPAALRLTAEGLHDAQVAAACRRAANRVEAGQSLSDALIVERAMPQTLALVVRWGERLSAQAEALRAASELFRGRMEMRADLLTAVIPPLAFLAVVIVSLWMLSAMFGPFIRLISSLT